MDEQNATLPDHASRQPDPERPQWAGGAVVIGGAVVSFALAFLLLVSLYRNRVATYRADSPEVSSAKGEANPATLAPDGSTDPSGGTAGPNAPAGMQPGSSGTSVQGGDPWEGKSITAAATAQSGPLRLQLERLTPLRFPRQRPIFFKGVLRNSGSAPIGFAKVEVRLMGGGSVVGKSIGYADARTLFPGEWSPVTILFSTPPDFNAATPVVLPPAAPYGTQHRSVLTITKANIVRSTPYSFHATGSVRNTDSAPLTGVRVFAVLRGAEQHLVGAGSGLLKRKVLAVGGEEPFSFIIMPTHGEPTGTDFRAEGRAAP